MNKLLILVIIVLAVSAVACQKSRQMTPAKEPAASPSTSANQATGNAVVSSIGNGINEIDSVSTDLGTDSLNDVDSGLADVEMI